jgi:hypothetical protein
MSENFRITLLIIWVNLILAVATHEVGKWLF